MNRIKLIVIGIVIIVLGIAASSTLFTVHQTRQAIVLEFGNPIRVLAEPGLKFKAPWQNVVEYERRVLDFDPPGEEVILSDQKRLKVDAYVRYKIVDPLKFFQTVQGEEGVRGRLSSVVNSNLRGVLGNVTLATVLSEDRAKIMSDLFEQVNGAVKEFGIQLIDVRLRRADLPDQAAQAVYDRMRSERVREAREFRAQGYEKAQQIRAGADRERTVLLAEARRTSDITRGEGEREQVRITGEAYGRDTEFYRFYRSMQAYRESLRSEDTTMVLSPDSDFFRFFNQSRENFSRESVTTGGRSSGSR
jgi:modulator of FtsH protease HflC